jgi:hypothetical protein
VLFTTGLVPLLMFGLAAGIVLMIEIGRRVGLRHRAEDPDGSTAGLGALEGAIFGLIGLLIAFTFSGAASRLDTRRQQILEEANDIGTAYLRLDLLPASAQPQLREDFRRYVDSRLAIYRALPDLEAAQARLAESNTIQGEIWTRAVAATKAAEVNGNAVTSLVLASLNDMIDITTTRTVASQTHPPAIIFWVLILMVLAGALLAGYGTAGSKRRGWLHTVGFAALMTVSIYVILDLEFPRFGLIRIDRFDQLLVDVRKNMK